MLPHSPENLPPIPDRSAGIPAVMRETRQSLNRLEQRFHHYAMPSMRTLSWMALLIGEILIVQALLVQWNVFDIGSHTPRPGLGLLAGALCVGAGLFLMQRKNQDEAQIRYLLAGTAIAVYIFAITLGGSGSVLYLSAVLAALHMLLYPVLALRVSLAVTALTLLLASVSLTSTQAPGLLGQLTAGLMVIAVMQALVRQYERSNVSALKDIRNFGNQVGRLESELIISLDEREIAEMTDGMTGLLNIGGFESVANAQISRAASDDSFHLLMIRFQKLEDYIAVLSVNERVLVLGNIVSRLKELAGEGAVLARIGKDEFAVLLPSDDLSDSEMDASIRLIHDSLKRPLAGASKSVVPAPAIGVSVWPEDSRDINRLLGMSEIALMRAIESRSGNPMHYDEVMQIEAEERAAITQDLELAIDRNEFELYYQPIIDLSSGVAHKVEALIRWNHPARGMISPVQFIPLAESSGQIIGLTEWVIDAALQQLRQWRTALDPDIEISVNIPSAYLEYCIENEEYVLERLVRMNIPSRGFTFEITEGSFLSMTAEMQRFMSILESIGIQIAMDDFGVGYSNLSQLERLPLNFLKIDKSFVDGIEYSSQKLAICRAIIKVGHELGLRIVAEGIENPGQQSLLSKAKCDFGQGYLFSKPLKAADLEILFRMKSQRPASHLNLV
jgi:EAL domain-containing protein (putative c-di-GMP-specific phosphodiesterase class I)/GGDEF domain-containing protein